MYKTMKKKWFVLLTLILIVAGTVLLMHSSYFEVKTILVMGNQQMSTEQIIQTSGIVKGQNIFLLPGREVANRLLNFVRIKGVKLERRFPDTVAIIINERSGLGLFSTKEGKWLEVSGDGEILGTYAEIPGNLSLPKVSGIQADVVDKRLQQTVEVGDVLELLQALFIWQRGITEVSYHPEDLQVLFTSGLVVYFGHASDLSANVAVLQSLLENFKKTGKLDKVAYIDLRYSGKPVIREK